MANFSPGPPQPDEYKPAFAGYIAKAQHVTDVVAELERQLSEVTALLRALPVEKRLYRYAPEKWSIQQLLGHLSDTERVFTYRTLRIARGDQTPLAGFEENDYAVAAESESCNWDDLVEEFGHVRRATIALLRNFPSSAWLRAGTASGATLSARAAVYIMIGHVAHHVSILRERYL
jgi:hypothetical protein